MASWNDITTWLATKLAAQKVLAADINLLSSNQQKIYENAQYLKDEVSAIGLTIGEIKLFDDYTEPSAAFPWFPLFSDDEIITYSAWPDLQAHWRNKLLRYMPGKSSAATEFEITAWAIVSNVATITYASTTPETVILAALGEDQLVHGSYTGWRTVTLKEAVGDISAGTYTITAIDPAAQTISFAYTASDNSSSGSWGTEFYPHRLSDADDSGGTQARHFQIVGRSFFTVNDAEGSWIGGLRRRDQMQGFRMAPLSGSTGFISNVASGGTGVITGGTFARIDATTGDPISDGTNGTPRTGLKTHSPGFATYAYIYGKTYNS